VSGRATPSGDGKTDLMITTPTGSYEYLAAGNGRFQPDVYVRTDLPLGAVQYVPGDFDGDGKTDLMVVTRDGSSEYLATGNGQFNPDIYVRTDLPIEAVQYTTGRFNIERSPRARAPPAGDLEIAGSIPGVKELERVVVERQRQGE
jgi:hypothetical protein